mgnify:CR=1 FL=1
MSASFFSAKDSFFVVFAVLLSAFSLVSPHPVRHNDNSAAINIMLINRFILPPYFSLHSYCLRVHFPLPHIAIPVLLYHYLAVPATAWLFQYLFFQNLNCAYSLCQTGTSSEKVLSRHRLVWYNILYKCRIYIYYRSYQMNGMLSQIYWGIYLLYRRRNL